MRCSELNDEKSVEAVNKKNDPLFYRFWRHLAARIKFSIQLLRGLSLTHLNFARVKTDPNHKNLLSPHEKKL